MTIYIRYYNAYYSTNILMVYGQNIPLCIHEDNVDHFIVMGKTNDKFSTAGNKWGRNKDTLFLLVLLVPGQLTPQLRTSGTPQKVTDLLFEREGSNVLYLRF